MDNYYPETDTDPVAEQPDKGMEKSGKADQGQTALLPKTILGGKDFEPGEEVVLKIEHVYEDEVEVSYATGESDKPKSGMDEAGEELDEMASKGE